MNPAPGPTSGYESLVAAVQQATGLDSSAAAVAVLRATLETAAEFAPPGQAAHLAARLPLEFRASLLLPAEIPGERSFGEFCCRLTVRTNSELLVALEHARRILRVLMQRTTPSLVRAQFPAGFDALFVDGETKTRR